MPNRIQKAGALPRMPFPKELAKSERDPPITTPKELQKYFEFYSIVGHGSIEPRDTGRLFIVPDRTYIMFTARAGDPTEKIKPKVDAILNEFRYKKNVEDDSSWFNRTFDNLERGDLFKDLLYDLSLSSDDNKKRISIYQPGDLIQDLTVHLENRSPPWDPVGVWKLPMNPATEDKLQTVRGSFNEKKKALYTTDPETMSILKNIHSYFDNLKSSFAVAAASGNTSNSNARKGIELVDTFENLIVNSDVYSHEELKHMDETKVIDTLQYFIEDDTNAVLKQFVIALNKKLLDLSEENMIDQSAFDGEPNNQLGNLMYTGKIDQRRTTSVYQLVEGIPSVSSNGTSTGTHPIYRFFIFDICRSLAETPYPVAKRLVRSLSNVMRFPNTVSAAPEADFPKFNTLLKLTREELQKLIGTVPAAKQNPIVQTLINGQPVTYRQVEQLFGDIEQYEGAFEEFIKYHRFDKGDEVIVMDPPDSLKHLNGQLVIIDSVQAIAGGPGGRALYYKVREPGSEKSIPIFNRLLWKSLEDYVNAVEERGTIQSEKKEMNNAIKQMAEKESREKQFETTLLHFTGYGKAINQFKIGDTVKVVGITAAKAIDQNGLLGIVVGNDFVTSKVTGEDTLRYEVSIISPGPFQHQTKLYPHFNLILEKKAFGGRYKKSRKVRKGKKQRTTRRH